MAAGFILPMVLVRPPKSEKMASQQREKILQSGQGFLISKPQMLWHCERSDFSLSSKLSPGSGMDWLGHAEWLASSNLGLICNGLCTSKKILEQLIWFTYYPDTSWTVSL